MTVVVVHQAKFRVVVLAAPLDWLGDGTAGGYLAVGGVGVGGADVASSPVYLPHVLGEVPAVGVPGGILLDGQGAGGYRLGGVPGDEPETGMVGALAVAACDLQVATVEEAVAGGDDAVFRHHLGGAAPHVVVGAGNGEVLSLFAEQHGAVLGIVGHIPDACAGLDAGLVAVVIVGGREDIVRLVFDGGVLVEGV